MSTAPSRKLEQFSVWWTKYWFTPIFSTFMWATCMHYSCSLQNSSDRSTIQLDLAIMKLKAMTNWVLVIALTILTSGWLKSCIAKDLEHCVVPAQPADVTGVIASPDIHAASDVRISLMSAYDVEVHLRLGGIPIAFTDDDSEIKAKKFRRGDSHMILIASTKPMNTSSLRIGLLTQHPCNTVAAWLDFDTIRQVFEKGISFPVVTEMPKRGYRVDKDDTVLLRYNVTYKSSGGLVASNETYYNHFRQPYHWHEDGILRGAMHPGDEERFKQNEVKIDERQRSSTGQNGYITMTSELEQRIGDSFPIDGILLYTSFTFIVGSERLEWVNKIDVYVYTSLHFTNNDDLPMGVEQLSWKLETFSLGFHKRKNFNMMIVGLNYQTPAESRGLSCLSVGLEDAPAIAIARLTSPDDFIGDVTKLEEKQVDLLLPGSHFGPIAFGDFKVDLPLGDEAYYVFRASTGAKVTKILIKVISIIPVKVTIEESKMEETERYEATCTATGSPQPTLRMFLVPEANVTHYDAYMYNDAARFLAVYQQFELMDQSGLLNVTTSSRKTLDKTLAFFWKDVFPDGHDSSVPFTLGCIASNVYQREVETNQIWYFPDDVYNYYDQTIDTRLDQTN